MLINGGLINGVALNASAPLGENIEELSETIGFSESKTMLSVIVGALDEVLSCLDDYSTGSTTSMEYIETITASDLIGVILEGDITSNISSTDAIIGVIDLVEAILDKLTANDSYISSLAGNSGLLDSVTARDSISFALLKEISENIHIIDALIESPDRNQSVIDNINMAESVSGYIHLISAIKEVFVISESQSISSVFSSIVDELISLSVGTGRDLEYLAYLLSTETQSVSTYTNYNFVGSCVFNDSPLFINKDGLFKYGGDTDNNENIDASVVTAALSFGTAHLKRVLNVYLGLTNSNHLVLKASADGLTTAYYEITRPTKNLETQRIKLGKGLVGRYWQFELITQDNTDFELESLDFLPISLSRRI